MQIKIRYNTLYNKDGETCPWRVIIDGKEHPAEQVVINTKAWTTCDEISPNLIKWHISCEGEVHWDGDVCLIS